MTPDDVRAAAEPLVEFHDRFAPLFGKEQARTHACDYLTPAQPEPRRRNSPRLAQVVLSGDPGPAFAPTPDRAGRITSWRMCSTRRCPDGMLTGWDRLQTPRKRAPGGRR